MGTFDRLLHPEDPSSYNSSQQEGIINGWIPGEITSLDDPEFLGRVKVKVFFFGGEDFPNSRDGYAWVGEEFTNAGRPGGSHRMLAVGAQVALLPMMGNATDFLLLACIPSRKEPPDPELDRNRGLYGQSSPGGVIEVHDDNTQSEIRAFPHGFIQHIDGEPEEGSEHRGTFTQETSGGARSQLKSNGDLALETPNSSTKMGADGEVETINASGARSSLEKDGTAKFQNSMGSGLTLGNIESTLTGPPGPIAALMQTVERSFGGNLGRSLQLVRRLERIFEQLNLPNLSDVAVSAIGERMIDILEDLGGGLGDTIAEGMKALGDLDNLSIDDLAKVVGPQVEKALNLDLGGMTGEITNILTSGNPLQELGRAFSPAIANTLGLPDSVISDIVGGAIAGDGLHFDQVLSGIREHLAPIVAADLGLPIENILADIREGVDIGDLGDRLKGIIPDDILSHPDIAFPPPELRESLGGLLERAAYSVEEQINLLLDAVIPGGFHAVENLVQSGVQSAIADIGEILSFEEITPGRDIEKEIRQVLPAVYQDIDSPTLQNLIHSSGTDKKENAKLALATLDKDYIHKTKETFEKVEDYGKKFRDAKDIAVGALHGYPEMVEKGSTGLSEGLDLSILRGMDFLPEPAIDEAIFRDPDELTEQTPLSDRLAETWEGYEFEDFTDIPPEEFAASSQIAALVSQPWASGLPKDDQLRGRLQAILPLIPPQFDVPLEKLEPLVIVGPTAPDINKLIRLTFQGLSTGDLGEFSEFAGISLDEVEEDEDIEDDDGGEDQEDDDGGEDQEDEFTQEVKEFEEGTPESSKKRLNLDDSDTEDDLEDEDEAEDPDSEPALPSAQDVADQLPFLAYQDIDFMTFMTISQVRGVIEQPWVEGSITEEQLEKRVTRVQDLLPEQYRGISREEVLEPLIAMSPGLGIDPDQLGQVVLKGLTENTLGDFARFGEESLDVLRPPQIDFESLDLQKFKKKEKDSKNKPPKKSGEAFKDVSGVVDDARNEDGEIQADKLDLKALLLSLVTPLIEDFKAIVQEAMEFFKNITDMIPDLIQGATVRLLPGIGQLVSSEIGGGSVIVTELAGALTGPGGVSSIVAGLGGLSMKFPKGSLDLGEDGGEALSEGKLAFRVAQDKGRSAGVIAEPDRGVTLATFSGTSDPKDWERYKTAEVRVDKGEILLKTQQGGASILLKGSDVYINGRRVNWYDWEDRIKYLEDTIAAQQEITDDTI